MAQAITLSEKDVRRVLKHCTLYRHSNRNRLLVQFSLLAGLRAKELAALKLADVYDDGGNVREQFVLSKAAAKGNRERVVWIGRKLRAEILACTTFDASKRYKPLFVSGKGGSAFTAHGITMLLKRIYSDAGVTGARSHSGRRSFITNLAAKGVGVRVLQELAGHSSLATTQRYIDVNDDMLRNAVEIL